MPQSRLVGTLLSPALKLWLRSQADAVESLSIKIKGSDRQILGGHIPGVELTATGAIYQGLHLADLQMTASSIRVNIGQVIRGKPLQLLESIEVAATVNLSNENLQQSVEAPLLANALVDIWQTLAAVAPELQTTWAIAPTPNPSIDLGHGYLDLGMNVMHSSHKQQQERSMLPTNPAKAEQTSTGPITAAATDRIILRTTLEIVEGHCLRLRQPQVFQSPVHTPQANTPDANTPDAKPQAQTPINIAPLDGFQIDLGTDVDIQSLAIAHHGLQCEGYIWVRP